MTAASIKAALQSIAAGASLDEAEEAILDAVATRADADAAK